MKSSVVRKNPSKKVKTAILTKEKTKHTKSSFDTAVLSLHPTDSSDNEEEMCVASDSSTTDTFIKKKKMTHFISWNCQGFKNKRDEIRDEIRSLIINL